MLANPLLPIVCFRLKCNVYCWDRVNGQDGRPRVLVAIVALGSWRYTLPISMDRPGYKGRGAPDIYILQLNGKTLMPYHPYPNRGSRPTAEPATCLGSETLVTGERGFTQAFGETGV